MISQSGQQVARLLVALCLLVLAGCSSSPPVPGTIGEQAASVALRQVGAPYRYGGKSPAGFDCSGLVYFAYGSVGLQVPRTTGGQWAEFETVARNEMRKGDLLFFRIDGQMSHVGMYIGGGQFVHAPSSGKHVSVETLDSRFYGNAFMRAGRPR